MDTLRASGYGLDIVDRARRGKKWSKTEKAWCELVPTSPATLKRFWAENAIQRETFINICKVVGVNWKEVCVAEETSADWLELDPNLSKDEGSNAISYADQSKQEPLTLEFYVERPSIESLCCETLLQPGSLIRVKAPSQTGKSLLMTRVLAQLQKQDYRTVSLSFKLAEKTHFTDLNKLLRWFCNIVSRELRLPNQLEDYWDEEGMGSKVSCTTYFEEYLLAQTNSPLALCLDDVHLVFRYPEISEDFFALLRSWHEKARSRKLWKKLRLAIVHSTDVYIQLNINQSPFNVGVPIELSEFTSKQVQDFAKQYGIDWDAVQVKQLMNMVGGHPYLVQQTLSYLKTRSDITLAELLEAAPTDAGIYSNHLRQHLLSLQQHPELAVALKKVVTTSVGVRLESMQTYKLQIMGLVNLQGNEVIPRCNLYRQYFCDRLLGNVEGNHLENKHI
jgi:hypothetical protein